MSNRFAWAWKLTDLGIPIVLVYLGFLGATEMKDNGQPLADAGAWESIVKRHSQVLFLPRCGVNDGYAGKIRSFR